MGAWLAATPLAPAVAAFFCRATASDRRPTQIARFARVWAWASFGVAPLAVLSANFRGALVLLAVPSLALVLAGVPRWRVVGGLGVITCIATLLCDPMVAFLLFPIALFCLPAGVLIAATPPPRHRMAIILSVLFVLLCGAELFALGGGIRWQS